MQRPELKFAALWIGTASICICSQNQLNVVGFDFVEGPQTSPRITIQVYNRASVAPRTLAAAEAEADRIFRDAGIATSWLNCPLSISEAQANPICIEPCPPNRLAVRIIADAPADSAKMLLGVALSEGGIYATIYYLRVDTNAKLQIAGHSQILGHAMAHEIGHLLLGPVPHTPSGIMRGQWTAEGLQSMAVGAIHFNPQQSALIRQAAMLRLRVQNSPAPE